MVSIVRVVTDSTADLPRELLEQLNIAVVPLKVMIDGESYRDGVDLTPKEFFQRLPYAKELPTTSQPSPGEFVQTYEKLRDEGAQKIIAIHLSGGLSGAVQAARLAKDMVTGVDIEVIDSYSASVGLGLIVLSAARAAQNGATGTEVVELVNSLIQKVQVFFVLDTLEYLQKGGRIGRAEAFLGNLLNIKPILSLVDGIITPVDKVRGQSKAIDRTIDLIKQASGGKRLEVAMVHANNFTDVMRLHDRVLNEFKCCELCELIISEVSPVLGTHVGPGLVGLGFYPID